MNYTSINYAGETVNGTLEWNGRQLVAVNQGNKRYEYSYNSDGLRTSVKTYSNNAPESIQYYIWQNGKLMGYFNEDKIGSNDTSVKMLYDNNDDLIGFRLVNEQIDYDKVLFFRKNLQGDIKSVYDSFGNQVLTYAYDAWGNVTATANTDSTQSTISAYVALKYVPITYRGYLYDANTGLYYLQSRYYNPTYSRFLNADSIMKTGEPIGANIFAYCSNNPVNFVDYDGRDENRISSVIADVLISIVLITILYKVLDDNNLDYVLDYEFGTYNMYVDNGGIISCILQTKISNLSDGPVVYTIKYGFGTVEQWYAYYDAKRSGILSFVSGVLTDIIANAFFGIFDKIGEVVSVILDNQTIIYNELDDLEEHLRYHQPYELMFRVDMISMCKIYTDSTLAIVDVLGESIHVYL